jgi:predicted ArsR family transcriptional regulator
MAESHPVSGSLPVLTEHNCAIRLVAERFPEVCAAEQRFIADLLGAPVTRQAHIAKGANCCEYCLEKSATSD